MNGIRKEIITEKKRIVRQNDPDRKRWASQKRQAKNQYQKGKKK